MLNGGPGSRNITAIAIKLLKSRKCGLSHHTTDLVHAFRFFGSGVTVSAVGGAGIIGEQISFQKVPPTKIYTILDHHNPSIDISKLLRIRGAFKLRNVLRSGWCCHFAKQSQKIITTPGNGNLAQIFEMRSKKSKKSVGTISYKNVSVVP